MGWSRTEYLLKGVFLGLWVFIGLQLPESPAQGAVIGWVLGCMGVGLAAGLALGIARLLARGIRPWQNWAAFPLLVLLENPLVISAGLVAGLAAGVFSGHAAAEGLVNQIGPTFNVTFDALRHRDPAKGWLLYCLAGGVVLGLALSRLREIQDPLWRLGVGFGIAVACVYLASHYLTRLPGLDNADERFNLGLYVLAGLPFFYLLTFVAEAEESEAEIMAICAGLGVSLTLMGAAEISPTLNAVGFLLPVSVYFVYATRVLPGLRVFKHTLRGYTYMNLGRLRDALGHFRRALRLDPANALARQGMLRLHQSLTLARIQADPELTHQLDFTMCLDRAGGLLLGRTPAAAEREEAGRFLDLVERQKPALQARVDYLRAVSLTYARDFDAAAGLLSRLLDPETPDDHPAVRRAVLFPAWDLALRLHPEIVARLGPRELDKPGRRIEAIAAVERQLKESPQDQTALELKAVLYSELKEGEYVAAAGDRPRPSGSTTSTSSSWASPWWTTRTRTGGSAAWRTCGSPAGACRRGGRASSASSPTRPSGVGDTEAARGYLEQVKRAGLTVGPAALAADQRETYLAALQKLADIEEARGDHGAAIDDLRHYLEGGGRAELAAYRRLADLWGKKGDPLNGLLMVETGLTYSGGDADLLKKKDSFYYSVTPERVAEARDRIGRWFDTAYCARKAAQALNVQRRRGRPARLGRAPVGAGHGDEAGEPPPSAWWTPASACAAASGTRPLKSWRTSASSPRAPARTRRPGSAPRGCWATSTWTS